MHSWIHSFHHPHKQQHFFSFLALCFAQGSVMQPWRRCCQERYFFIFPPQQFCKMLLQRQRRNPRPTHCVHCKNKKRFAQFRIMLGKLWYKVVVVFFISIMYKKFPVQVCLMTASYLSKQALLSIDEHLLSNEHRKWWSGRPLHLQKVSKWTEYPINNTQNQGPRSETHFTCASSCFFLFFSGRSFRAGKQLQANFPSSTHSAMAKKTNNEWKQGRSLRIRQASAVYPSQ